MTITPPPLSADELAELSKLCESGVTTLADATLILISVPRLQAEIERLRAALEAIRDHSCTDYNHPLANHEMYRGPYGIGVVDGHRAAAIIARAALSKATP